jgi:hypothetical protein
VILDKGCASAEVYSRSLRYGTQYFVKDRSKIGLLVRRARKESEVEILRESVRLEVTLLEGSSALEDPRLTQNRMSTDSPEDPSENIVLFDHVFSKTPLSHAILEI